MKFNYSQICLSLLRNLPKKQKEIISRRFALSAAPDAERETLQLIGENYGITRERVRQIEDDGFSKLQPELTKYQKVFQYFQQYLKSIGGLKRESSILEEFGGEKWKNQVYFLLTLSEELQRVGENNDFYSLWAVDQNYLVSAKKIIDSLQEKLKKVGKPLKFEELTSSGSLNKKFVTSYLEISKKIQKNSDGFYGLRDWPEINPRGVKDRAFLVFKKESKPLHFTQVTSLINSLSREEFQKQGRTFRANLQTVHNELIKDPRFVLVGRGIYALKEWGYDSGCVKDVISKAIREAGKPLTKDEILDKVLKQRLVKENTVLLNLNNKKYFSKISDGIYDIKTA